MKSNIIIHGSYFANNYGDTLLVQETRSVIDDLFPLAKKFLARSPTKDEKKFLKMDVWRRERPSAIIFTGGGYLGENAASSISKRQIWSLRNYFRHFHWIPKLPPEVKILFLCIGYGPISAFWFRKKVIARLNNASLIVFRDTESFDNYKRDGGSNPNAFVLNDLILLRMSLAKPKPPSNGRTLGIHLNSFTPEKLMDVLSAVKNNIEKFEGLVLFYDASTRHRKKLNEICKVMFPKNKLTFVDYVDPLHLGETLNDINYVITAKLHVGIVSLSLGKKVLSIAHHGKTKRLYKQLGLEQWCIGPRDFSVTNIDGKLKNMFKNEYREIDRQLLRKNYEILLNKIRRAML